jgi:SAM-dependent methyltransferase
VLRVTDTDKAFAGSIPGIYETYLVPLIFQPYADDLASRVASRSAARVLEVAAGTGVVTRALDTVLPKETSIMATDLNQAMLDQAATRSIGARVEWRQADALSLPFADEEFDVVVCQFGVMFFPDKPRAFSEVRRVLRPNGRFIFSVWDRLGENELADVVESAVAPLFPDDPPKFLSRAPYGYFDRTKIQQDLANGGFAAPAKIDTVAERSRADSPRGPAVGFCEGTPLRAEIEARDASKLGAATDRVAGAIAQRFGRGAVDANMQALIVSVDR